MNILIAGSTCSGKSTFIYSNEAASFLYPLPVPTNVVYGFQVTRDTAFTDSFIHYNMLHPRLIQKISSSTIPEELPDFELEPIFKKIIDHQKIGLAIVLVAPKSELLARAENRQFNEERVQQKQPYDGLLWQEIIKSTNLPALYERFFLVLKKFGIPYKVVTSSNLLIERFRLSDRVYVPANLRGEMPVMPDKSTIESILNHPGCHYQSVLLPYGVTTNIGEYSHISSGRHETFDVVLNEKLMQKSILDVGCALGDLLYRAERLGALRLVGVEPHPARFETAIAIARLLNSSADIQQCDFMDFEEDEIFDHVFVMNVIHHVPNFLAFLEKASRLAKDSLTIEFPTLKDEKFRKANGYWLPSILNWLPIVGVSTTAADQTCVFSPKAIERICLERVDGFNKVFRFQSPLKGRLILRFEK
jgi:SAM-dependent methyltransferase